MVCRPLYLPARVFVSVGTLNVSSNIVAQTSTSVLRFVIEDAALHLSNRVYNGTVNFQRDYVCVLDIDVLELSLRSENSKPSTDTATTGNQPSSSGTVFELQSLLNMVRLRTCADSCRLLLDLLTYLANDGDYDEKGVALSEDSSESSLNVRNGMGSVAGGSLSSLQGQEMAAQVNVLMEEAMLETGPDKTDLQPKAPPKGELYSGPSTEVFFFPDESRMPPSKIHHDNTDDQQVGSGDPCGVWHDGIDQTLMDDALDPACDDLPHPEEEFCILENDPGVGFTVSCSSHYPLVLPAVHEMCSYCLRYSLAEVSPRSGN